MSLLASQNYTDNKSIGQVRKLWQAERRMQRVIRMQSIRTLFSQIGRTKLVSATPNSSIRRTFF